MSRLTIHRDGTISQDDFIDGVISHRVIAHDTDIPGRSEGRTWDQIEFRYDASGALERSTIFQMDGTVRDVFFATGPRRMVVQDGYDAKPVQDDNIQSLVVIGDDSALSTHLFNASTTKAQTGKSWTWIETLYGPDGGQIQKTTIYDNGTASVSHFVEGAVAEVTKTTCPVDADSPWLVLDIRHDPNGHLCQREFTFADQSMRSESITCGVVREVLEDTVVVDTAGEHVSSASVSTFDADGIIQRRVTVLESGVELNEVFQEGALRLKVEQGNPGNEPAAMVDDADHSDDALESLFFDGDPSDAFVFVTADTKPLRPVAETLPWIARRTIYDHNGAVVDVTEFTDADVLPDDLTVLPQENRPAIAAVA